MKKFLAASFLATFGLVLGVMLFQWFMQLVNGSELTPSGSYTGRAIVWGAIADSIRGVILAYLYPRTLHAGRSYIHAINFGIIMSLMVASLYVFYQYGANPELGFEFLISKTVIILLQGALSGIGLWLIYKSNDTKRAIGQPGSQV